MAGIVRNLMVRAVADFSGLQRSMQQAQRETSAFANGMEKAFGGLKSKLALLGTALVGGEAIKDSINDAIELEATTQNLNYLLGQSADAYKQWAATVGLSYGYSQLEAEKYGANFARMISLFSNGTQETTKRTEDLMKASAIIANGTGRSIDDVVERIRSGMMGNTEAIEDLGVFVNQSMIQNTEAFRKFANGKHWADLSYNTKQQILYYAILEQATKQYGNTLQNNVHNKLVQFTASLKNLRAALGNAFLPLLNIALPVITKFIQGITVALNYFAAFMRVLFGFKDANAKQAADTAKTAAATAKATNATNAQTGAVKKLTQATKDQQKAQMSLAGIDEINSIKSANNAMSGAGDSGVGGTGGTPNIPPITPPDDNGFKDAIDKIEAKVKEYADNVKAWLEPLKPYWDKITEAVGNLWESIKILFTSQGMQDVLGWLGNVAQLGAETLLNDVADAIDALGRAIKGIGEAMNGDWTKAWSDWQIAVKDINDIFGIFAPTVIAIGTALGAFALISGIVKGYEAWTAAQAALNVVMDANPIGLISVAIGLLVATVIELAANWDDVVKGFQSFCTWLNSVMTTAGGWIQTISDSFKAIGSNIGDWITQTINSLGGFIQGMSDTLKGIGKGIIDKIGEGIGDMSKWIKTNVVDKITGAFGALGDLGKTIYGYVKSGWSGLYDWFKKNIADHIGTAFNSLGKLGSTIWGYVKSGWSGVYTWFKTNIVDHVSSAFSGVKNLGSQIWAGLKSGWGSVSSWFEKNIATPIHSVFSKITSGLGNAITSGFKSVYNTAAGFINYFIGLLNDMIKKLKDINIFGNHPFSGLPTIKPLQYLAKGGIVNSPTLAMVGEAGKEAVMPLENNTGWINELAAKINTLNGGGQGGTTEVILQLNETTLGKAVIGAINKVHRRGGKVLLNV